MKLYLLLSASIYVLPLPAQVTNAPQPSQHRSFQTAIPTPQQSVTIPGYSNYISPSLRSTGQVQMGAAWQDIISRNNQQNLTAVHSAVSQKRAEVEALMREIEADAKRMSASDPARVNYWPYANPERTKDFPRALEQLQNMLSGREKLSVANAYYTVEAAYGDPYLTKQQYDNIVRESAVFIRTWMQQNGLNAKDNYAVHYAIRTFMSETLTINKTVKNGDKGTKIETVTHQPFHYDYNDYKGEKDYRNVFLTKCLATGFGQCASMPAVYLVLAEALGVKAYLSFAPNHSFIKYPDNSGYIVNYEPTSNWEISDKWYKDNLFISAEAVASGIYLDTLNSRQIVANCAFDLAVQYMRVDLTGNETLITDCIRVGIPYFPKNNNLQSLFIYSLHLKTMLREIMRKSSIASLDDIERIPEAKKYYKEFLSNEAYIAKLGYQDMPPDMYEAMLKQHEFKGKVQQDHKVSGKEKRNLFNKIEQR